MSARAHFEDLDFPPWAVWKQRGGMTFDWSRIPKHDGKNGCQWCGAKCPGRRTAWCSDVCQKKWGRVWCWRAMRRYIFERDKGVCVLCVQFVGTTNPKDLPGGRLDDWDVDHIREIRRGGTDDPANLRLVHYDCHVVRHTQVKQPPRNQQPHKKHPKRRAKPSMFREGIPTDQPLTFGQKRDPEPWDFNV